MMNISLSPQPEALEDIVSGNFEAALGRVEPITDHLQSLGLQFLALR